MRAAVVHDFARPLSLDEVPKPRPLAGEVVVRVETCGICHSDMHAARGEWPIKSNLPFIPGHEGIGRVDAIGPGVSEVRPGERVAIPWLGFACGACAYCVDGRETLCERQRNPGYTVDGAYAEYAKAAARYVGKVPDGLDPLDAAALTCAGVSTYKAVKAAKVRSTELVAVFGVGGLGHLALQYAKIAGADAVAAVSRSEEKLQLARDLGAEHTVNAVRQDPVAAIQDLGGAHAAVYAGVDAAVIQQAFRSLRRGGRLVLVGLPADQSMCLSVYDTVLKEISVIGSIVGTRGDLAETYRLHAQGRTRVVRQTGRLDEVNQCFEDIDKGRVKARVVLDLRD